MTARDQQNPEEQRLETIGKMAAFISHEIKNSLVTIGGLARMVQRAIEDRPKEQQRLGTIISEVNNLEGLVQNVLTFARQPKAEPEPYNINTVAETAFETIAQQTPSRIKMEKNLQHDLPLVKIDPTMIRQVLVNLLRNAIEAISEEGTVTLQTLERESTIEIIITDTGTGMPPEVLENLFDRYYTTKEAGTGLGMAIAGEIIESHNGTILACSAEGEGSEFHINLPK